MYLYLATAVLVFCACLARMLQGNWAAPGAFYALVWMVAAVPAVIILPRDVSPTAILFVSSFVVAVLVGSHLGGGDGVPLRSPGPAHGPVSDQRDMPARQTALIAMAVLLGLCGIFAVVGYVWGAGYSLLDLSRSGTWIKMAVHYTVARYNQGYEPPIAVRLLTAANYAGGIVAGIALAMPGRKLRRAALSLPLIAGALSAIITTAKAPMVITCITVFAGWLSVRVSTHAATVRRRSWKKLFVFGPIVIGGAVLIFASFVLRYGPGRASYGLILQRIGGYVFGQMAALSAWLSLVDWSDLAPRWGEMTFSGLAAALHLRDRVPGLYATIDLNGWAALSNVFTALRGLVEDYGLVGAWAVAVFGGVIGGRCYERLRSGPATPTSLLGLVVFYICAAFSPVISIFDYNVILLAIVIAAVVIAGTWKEVTGGISRAFAETRFDRRYRTAPT